MDTEFDNLDHNEIIKKLNHKFPNWINNIVDNYRKDYDYLNSNWVKLCEKLNTTPKKILLVNYLPHPNDKNKNNDILQYSDLLTKHGYVVRRESEFLVQDNLIFPTEDLYNYMINIPKLKPFLPTKWVKNL